MPAVQAETLADEQSARLGSQLATKADVAELAARLARVPARQEAPSVKAGIAAIKEDLAVIRARADLSIRMLSASGSVSW